MWIGVQKSLAYKAEGTFSSGLKMDITPYVTWLSDKPAVVSISNAFASKGAAKGLSKGATNIKAVRDGVTGKVTVTVQ